MQWKKLEDRMNYYRGLTDYRLPCKSYCIGMLDGRSFSRYSKKLEQPFDEGFIADMDETAKYLCEKISGVRFAFVQSDEINLFLCDYEQRETQAWFDYRLCKMHSLSAAMAASKFNQLRLLREIALKDKTDYRLSDCISDIEQQTLCEFDSKFWTVPTQNDVYSWFLHRQNDCTRNSILMAAQAHFSHKEMMNKKTPELQEMLFTQKSINWSAYPAGQKRGRLVVKELYKTPCSSGSGDNYVAFEVERSHWVAKDAPIFKHDEGKEELLSLIPINQ